MTRYLPHALVALALLVAAYLLGRAHAPEPEVRIEERTRTEYVATASLAEEWVSRRDWTEAISTTRVVYRERLPDGTERELERTETGERRTEQTSGHVSRVEVVEVERVVELERLVEVRTPLPDWRVGALVGWGGELVYGAQVERRILGPVSLGAWGHTGGVVGVGVAIEFD